MKNEALIKDYLEEKDKLINNLVKDLKEHFGILEDFNNHSEKDFIQTILKCYNIVYHLNLSVFIEYDKDNKITKVKYTYYITLNHIDYILEKVAVEKDLETIAKEVIEASIKDLDKRI